MGALSGELLRTPEGLQLMSLSFRVPNYPEVVGIDESLSSARCEAVFLGIAQNANKRINGGAIIDHKAPRERRFVAVKK